MEAMMEDMCLCRLLLNLIKKHENGQNSKWINFMLHQACIINAQICLNWLEYKGFLHRSEFCIIPRWTPCWKACSCWYSVQFNQNSEKWLKFNMVFIDICWISLCFIQEYVGYVIFALKLLEKTHTGHVHVF